MPLNDSTYPFSQGLPGSMNSVSTFSAASQCRTSSAVNSGPLSERRCSGTPCITNKSANVSRTSSDRNRRATTIARHSREYSSTTVRIFNARPSCVRAVTKSYAQT